MLFRSDEVLVAVVAQPVGLPRAGDRDGFGPDDGLPALTVGEDAPAGEDDVGVLVVDVRMHADAVALFQRHEAYFLDGLIVGGRFPSEGEPAVERADPRLAGLFSFERQIGKRLS